MSTRSEIHIFGKTGEPFIRLYHHYDGYPDGVGCFLMEEVYPKLMSSNSNTAEDIARFLVYHTSDDGFEYTNGVHPDIEFLYKINVPAKTIRCFDGHYATLKKNWELIKPERFLVSQECNLKVFLPINKRIKYA